MASNTPVPCLHLLRHAQAEHNVNRGAHHKRDTDLTEAGELEARNLRHVIPPSIRNRIGFFSSSPLRRTLYTTLLAFEDLLLNETTPARSQRTTPSLTGSSNSTPSAISRSSSSDRSPRNIVIALPEAQETSNYPCDTGSSADSLEAEFNAPDTKWRGVVDFSLLTDDWNSKEGKWADDSEALKARAREVRRWCREKLKEREGTEKPDVVLVAHGAVLHYITQVWDRDPVSGTGWRNTEMRSFQFVDGLGGGDDDAKIEETVESKQDRERNGPLCGLNEYVRTSHPAPTGETITSEL